MGLEPLRSIHLANLGDVEFRVSRWLATVTFAEVTTGIGVEARGLFSLPLKFIGVHRPMPCNAQRLERLATGGTDRSHISVRWGERRERGSIQIIKREMQEPREFQCKLETRRMPPPF